MKYYFGVYVEYTDPNRPRIGQLTLSVDDLSCEMLADPGLITFEYSTRAFAVIHGKELAKTHNCKFIELGWGNYNLTRIKGV